MRIFVILLAAFIVAATRVRPINRKFVPLKKFHNAPITNGYRVAAGQVPYIVYLECDKGASYSVCGGSIIGHTWVITAKHCTKGTRSAKIFYGSIERQKAVLKHTVNKNNYIEHDSADIVLLRTPHVEFSALINKVPLPPFQDRQSYNNYWGKICGWGTTELGSLSYFLKCANVQIVPDSVCENYYYVREPSIICVPSPKNENGCNGDSGGPLVLDTFKYQVGVFSFGSSEGCLTGAPKGLVRLTTYLGWIYKVTGISY